MHIVVKQLQIQLEKSYEESMCIMHAIHIHIFIVDLLKNKQREIVKVYACTMTIRMQHNFYSNRGFV